MRYFEDRTCEVLEDAYSLSCEMTPGKKGVCSGMIYCQMTDSRARVSGRIRLSEKSSGDDADSLRGNAEFIADYT